MTEYKELAARLRHLVSLNEPEKGGPYGGYAAAEFVKAGAEAASAIEALEAERDARSEDSDTYKAAMKTYFERALAAEARCKRLAAQVEQAFRDGLAYATNVVVTDTDEAWRTSRARLALQENTNGG